MKILILGGNGFIGSELACAFVAHGHDVTCLGREVALASRRLPQATWERVDLRKLSSPQDWSRWLRDCDVVINAAGVLQQGLRDDPAAVQQMAMLALYQAARIGGQRIVQISANTDDAETQFLSTKLAADNALKASGLRHGIIRPALVVGRNAHGGTALVRSLAAIPFVTPLVFGDSLVRTTSMKDLCDLVLDAAKGALGDSADIALCSEQPMTLRAVVAAHRGWLGLAPVPAVAVPGFVARAASWMADLAGQLGWRSPMRSTAMAVMAGGVDAPATGEMRASQSLAQTLAQYPAGAQDVWFARLYLFKAAIIPCLSVFWLASGIIALATFAQASAMLEKAGFSQSLAVAVTAATSLADIALGAAVLMRRWHQPALKGMLALSLAYLAGGTVLAPQLWFDPLGPYVKVLPSMFLAVVALAISAER